MIAILMRAGYDLKTDCVIHQGICCYFVRNLEVFVDELVIRGSTGRCPGEGTPLYMRL